MQGFCIPVSNRTLERAGRQYPCSGNPFRIASSFRPHLILMSPHVPRPSTLVIHMPASIVLCFIRKYDGEPVDDQVIHSFHALAATQSYNFPTKVPDKETVDQS